MEVKRTTGPRIYDRCLAIACGYLGGAEAITKRPGGHLALRAGLVGSDTHIGRDAYQLGRRVCEVLLVDRFTTDALDWRYNTMREVDNELGIEPVDAALEALLDDVDAEIENVASQTSFDFRRRRTTPSSSRLAQASAVFCHLARSETFASLAEIARAMGLKHATAAYYLRMAPDPKIVEAVRQRRAAKADQE